MMRGQGKFQGGYHQSTIKNIKLARGGLKGALETYCMVTAYLEGSTEISKGKSEYI